VCEGVYQYEHNGDSVIYSALMLFNKRAVPIKRHVKTNDKHYANYALNNEDD